MVSHEYVHNLDLIEWTMLALLSERRTIIGQILLPIIDMSYTWNTMTLFKSVILSSWDLTTRRERSALDFHMYRICPPIAIPGIFLLSTVADYENIDEKYIPDCNHYLK